MSNTPASQLPPNSASSNVRSGADNDPQSPISSPSAPTYHTRSGSDDRKIELLPLLQKDANKKEDKDNKKPEAPKLKDAEPLYILRHTPYTGHARHIGYKQGDDKDMDRSRGLENFERNRELHNEEEKAEAQLANPTSQPKPFMEVMKDSQAKLEQAFVERLRPPSTTANASAPQPDPQQSADGKRHAADDKKSDAEAQKTKDMRNIELINQSFNKI